MPEPSQHPPQTRGDHAALSVVGDDLLPGIDTGFSELLHQDIRVGERVAPVPSPFRSGEILVEMQKLRARNVRRRVFTAAALGRSEIVPAIKNDPVGIGEMRREDFCADERGENHVSILI